MLDHEITTQIVNGLRNYKMRRGTMQALEDYREKLIAENKGTELSPFAEGVMSYITNMDALAIGNGTFDTITLIEGKKVNLCKSST